MAYNFDKDTCDKCGVSKAQLKKLPPFDTGINHPEYRWSRSMSLGFDGSVLCPRCAKEQELKGLFDLMDKAEARARKGVANVPSTQT